MKSLWLEGGNFDISPSLKVLEMGLLILSEGESQGNYKH